MFRRLSLTFLGLLVLALAMVAVVNLIYPRDHSAGVIRARARPTESVAAQRAERTSAARTLRARSAHAGGGGTFDPKPRDKQILFGDLHVHSTFSIDAFVFSLPLFGGEGAHPPADACDFARHCAALDFFSINDHAEGLTPAMWSETKESIRQCNELAGDPKNPDLVAYVGWEWTQTGNTPETHYGHRNVILPGLADEELPARPIAALPEGTTDRARGMWAVWGIEKLGPFGLGDYADFLWYIRQIAQTPDCPSGVDVRALPADCRENAQTPAELFEKLAQWGYETLVIPHGLAWGTHAPPGARLDFSLANGNHDPSRERLLEVFSGHGNSEEWRAAAQSGEYAFDEAGEQICAEPSPGYLPCCWRAGEIVRERCGDLSKAQCEGRVVEARRLALEAGVSPHLVLPDTQPEDWLDCGQCRDCFKPAMNLRPGETAQYSLAIARFEGPDPEDHFRWGFIASTDNHSARPGTGYKQYARQLMTDARGIRSERLDEITRPYIWGEQLDPQRAQPAPEAVRGFRRLLDTERQASFMYPGGLVAVHAAGRDRRAIWDALMRKEVYGTTGPRILLWFDLLNGPDGVAPMGSEVVPPETILVPAPMDWEDLLEQAPEAREERWVPRFEVRAVGSFVQKPGCPSGTAESASGLAPERLERLCRGECYHPSDERVPIRAIEIVRVLPQLAPDEPVADLIEDPWRRFDCVGDKGGCVVRFQDPEYPLLAASGRTAVYYARVLQAPTPAINGANLRTEFDADGNALRTRPCFGNHRTRFSENCLAPVQERAWSSPLWLDPPR